MQLTELSPGALETANRDVGDGPVVMLNLLWFRDATAYPADFPDPKPDSRTAYYEGYAGAFRAVAQELGIGGIEVVYAGRRVHGLLAGVDDDWDDIVLVRYETLGDLRRILESETYARTANPHRLAGVANWRFIATRDR
jgi:hypothetical protein